jgi:hypothetical protein
MFTGAGGLADYNMPEDVNFLGVALLYTPSPAELQSPASGMSSPAAASALSVGSLGGISPGTPDRKVQLSSSPAPTVCRGIAPLLAKDGSKPGAAPAAVWLLWDWLDMSALLRKLWLKQGLPRVEDGEAALASTARVQWQKPW